jgi:hypothetical protein
MQVKKLHKVAAKPENSAFYNSSLIYHPKLNLNFELVQTMREEQRYKLATSGELRQIYDINQVSIEITKPGENSCGCFFIDLKRPLKEMASFAGYSIQVVPLGNAEIELIFSKKKFFWVSEITRMRFAVNGWGTDPCSPFTPVSVEAIYAVGSNTERVYLSPKLMT